MLYIYSTNIGTEYFKHGIYSPFFSLQNAVCFTILMYLVPVLFTFYLQGVLKLKKNNSGSKRLMRNGNIFAGEILWYRPVLGRYGLKVGCGFGFTTRKIESWYISVGLVTRQQARYRRNHGSIPVRYNCVFLLSIAYRVYWDVLCHVYDDVSLSNFVNCF